MSLGVSRFGPGIGTAPIRMQPSSAAYHSGIRGSITNTWSPWVTPAASSARAARREALARSAIVSRPTTSPAPSSDRTAGSSGAAAAQPSTIDRTALNRSGTCTR